jgi:DEAD/DEAH box helicase domain-containing protein
VQVAGQGHDEWSGQLSLFDDNSAREAPTGRRIVVFDLETQRSFQDVGNRSGMRQLGMSLGVTYSFAEDRFTTYLEDGVDRLIEQLAQAELVIGYNLIAFDYEVLHGYRDGACAGLTTLDIMIDLQGKLGFRPKLDSVVSATLGAGKSADGLQALTWWKEGRIDLIEKYCTDDVRLTRDLYLYGRRNRHVLVSRFSGPAVKVEVSW